MILVTGATGQLGRLVLSELLKRPFPAGQIVAGVRDPEKAKDLAALGVKVRVADYDRPATLDEALQGVERILFISGSDVSKRMPQHEAVVAAAKKARVKLLAYTSILHGERSGMALAADHVATERLIRASGLRYVFLRHGWYMENYTGNIGPALQHGAVLGSAKDGRVAPATRADLAAADAAVVATAGHEDKVYELAGDQAFSMAEFAAELSRQSGKPVVYKDLPVEQYAETLVSFGLPKGYAAALADSDVGISRGALNDESHTLSKLIGRPTTTLAEALKAALALKK